MAFLPGRNRTYLFGGSSGSIETWAWDGKYWTQVARIGPDGRTAHSTTFDPTRGHIVLFGGQPSPGKALQDTWAFGGEEWTQLEDLGPTPRHDHATAYDLTRSRLVLFGGLQSSNGTTGVVGDTWEWDGTSWTQIEETGPAPRCGHAMAYDSLKQRILLFGGLVGTGGGGVLQPVGDTWEWDGASWTQVADTGPAARTGAAMASSGRTLILHGGKSDHSLGDTWQWADSAWSKLQDIGPERRYAHAITYDTARQRIVLFGGEREPDNPQNQEPEYFADTWEAPKTADGPGDPGGLPPSIGGCTIFPADNAWNTRIDDTRKFPVHAKWSTYMTTMNLTKQLHPDWGDWSTNHYGIPWQTVGAGQAKVPMTFQYSDESDPGPYPFPPDAKVEGGAGSGGDMHVLVIDTSTCTLYETWNSTFTSPGWSCASGAKFDLKTGALRPDGWSSADAAGLPILPGLVKVSEVQAGSINHAIRFTMNSTQQAYIHPATHAAGTKDATLPPMGLRLRLKASFDTSAFSGPTKVILVAMQQYGLILADNGSDWYFSGDSDDAWSPMMEKLVTDFGKVHGSDFEAVESGAISTAGL